MALAGLTAAFALPLCGFRHTSKARIALGCDRRLGRRFSLNLVPVANGGLFSAALTGGFPCDNPARSSMILGNPTETTMGSDEKRSGDGRRTSKERRSGTDTRSEAEKQLVGERRSGADRRSNPDRRARPGDKPPESKK